MTLSEIRAKDQHDLDFRTLVQLLETLETLPRKWWGPREYANWHLAQQCLRELRDRNDPHQEQLT